MPTALVQGIRSTLCRLRVIPPPNNSRQHSSHDLAAQKTTAPRQAASSACTRLRFPINFLTAPLIADLFLLIISAIGREEVYGGTIGANNIQPIDIMVFFITLAYIAISIDASGLIRYLAFRVLQWGGKVGHKLFFYLYAFFFILGTFIGNDPIILSGTAFLAYMTRVSNNIEHPRAWIHTQFAVANIASAILVSSNPTNLVLAGAFNIKFIDYTANMIVPVVITGIVLFPFLLYIIFAHERLIPSKITMHELPDEIKAKKPVNPNIPNARGIAQNWEDENANNEQVQLLSLEEVLNPFLDKGGAVFGAVLMAVTLITVLVLNAVSQATGEHPVYWVTLPAAFVMFCWDVAFGWIHRHETREIAQRGRKELETLQAERLTRKQETARSNALLQKDEDPSAKGKTSPVLLENNGPREETASRSGDSNIDETKNIELMEIRPAMESHITTKPNQTEANGVVPQAKESQDNRKGGLDSNDKVDGQQDKDIEPATHQKHDALLPARHRESRTLVSLMEDAYSWCQETFPTVAAVLRHLPFALVPFAFSMFVLVEALVTKGWVSVFAYGWDHWVTKTGTIGAIGGMAFLSVILCNVSGTSSPIQSGRGSDY